MTSAQTLTLTLTRTLFDSLTSAQVIHKEGVLKLSAKEIHSFDSMSAFAVLLRPLVRSGRDSMLVEYIGRTYRVYLLLLPSLLSV